MYFLHEHPWTARSWNETCVKNIAANDEVEIVKGDMCCFGMYQETQEGEMLVKKPTGFMTNAYAIARELEVKCNGLHKHVHLMNGRAKRAEVYPDELCYRILRGLLQQMRRDGRIQAGQIGAIGPEDEACNEYMQGEPDMMAYDDQTGEELNPELVLCTQGGNGRGTQA